VSQEIFAQLITPQVNGCSCCSVVADAQFLSINSNSIDYTPGVEPLVSTVNATSSYFCNDTSSATVNFGEFIGGSGAYMMTTNYYSTCGEALSANDFATVGISNTYYSVPNGTWYFGLKDVNNSSNLVCLAVQVNCVVDNSLQCGASVENTYSGNQQYTYPNQPISSGVDSYISFSWSVVDRPNRFTVYDSTGLRWTSGWVGYADYDGPWGDSLNTPSTGNSNICFLSSSGRYVLVEAGNASPTSPISDAFNYTITCVGNCPSSGGGCPTPDMLIMVDGGWVKAEDLNIGDTVYTTHEITNEWGNYIIKDKRIEHQTVLLTVIGDTTVKVSDSHKFLTENGTYTSISEINVGDMVQTVDGLKKLVSKDDIGEMEVVRFEIEDAHTYVVDGIISHNKLSPS
jgi:hypothetical protein